MEFFLPRLSHVRFKWGYISRDTFPIMKCLAKHSLIKHTCSWRVNLLFYEHWTDKWNYFYIASSASGKYFLPFPCHCDNFFFLSYFFPVNLNSISFATAPMEKSLWIIYVTTNSLCSTIEKIVIIMFVEHSQRRT